MTTAGNDLGLDKKRWKPPSDRPMSVRLAAARDRWPDLVERLEGAIGKRADRAQISRFLAEVACGSAEESLFDLRTLDYGARCVRASGQKAGFRLRPLVDPVSGLVVGDLRIPALELEFDGIRLLLLPQVTLQVLARTRDGINKLRRPTVDFLVKVVAHGRVVWLILEVDGTGHDPEGDEIRAEQIGLPLIRLRTRDVVSDQCLEILKSRLLDLLGC